MPNYAAPRKPRRLGLIAPFVLLALAVAAWSGWWLYLRGQVVSRMDAAVAEMKAEGYTVAWASRSVGGYPFRISITLDQAQIAEPSGYGLSAPVLEVESAAYTINPVGLAAPEGAVIRRPGNQAFAVKGRILRASVSHLERTPPRIAIQGVDLEFGALKGAEPLSFSAMKIFEARITPADGDKADVFVRLDQATPANNALLARVANGAPVTIGFEGTINGASFLRGSGWAEVLGRWSAAKGSLAVQQGGIMAGEAVLSVKPSTLAVDASGRLAGDLALSLARAPQGVMALGAVGVLPEETAAVASGLTGVQLPGKPLDATLNFHDGQTWLGPLPLGPAPRVY
jgi:hypothetical protein